MRLLGGEAPGLPQPGVDAATPPGWFRHQTPTPAGAQPPTPFYMNPEYAKAASPGFLQAFFNEMDRLEA